GVVTSERRAGRHRRAADGTARADRVVAAAAPQEPRGHGGDEAKDDSDGGVGDEATLVHVFPPYVAGARLARPASRATINGRANSDSSRRARAAAVGSSREPITGAASCVKAQPVVPGAGRPGPCYLRPRALRVTARS